MICPTEGVEGCYTIHQQFCSVNERHTGSLDCLSGTDRYPLRGEAETCPETPSDGSGSKLMEEHP